MRKPDPRRSFISAVALTPLAISACAYAQPVISETLDTSLNGWTTYADAAGLTWESGAGNPGGCARARDLNSGVLWGFSAPAPFRGDKSCYYGGTLSWEVRSTHGSNSYSNSADLSIFSPTLTLVYVVPGFPTPNVWNGNSAPLSETGWHIGAENGVAPTQAEFQSVLANITDIRFNCEWSASVDTGRIDNVVLTPGNGCTPACPADYNDDGGVDGDDVIVFFSDWDTGNIAADYNDDGGVDGDDAIGFFASWDGGC